jgi:hypothetical protein
MSKKNLTLYTVLLKVQGTYYLLTGLWPLISMSTFLMVTGSKTDLWLVEVVGILIAVISVAMLTASLEKRINIPVVVLAVGTALGLGIAELVYYFSGTIPFIYVLDAVLEFVLVALWLVAVRRK